MITSVIILVRRTIIAARVTTAQRWPGKERGLGYTVLQPAPLPGTRSINKYRNTFSHCQVVCCPAQRCGVGGWLYLGPSLTRYSYF